MSDENRFGHNDLPRRIDPNIPAALSIFFYDARFQFFRARPRARAQGPGGGARGGPSGGEAAELKGSPGRHGKCVVFVLKISPSDRDGVELSFNVL